MASRHQQVILPKDLPKEVGAREAKKARDGVSIPGVLACRNGRHTLHFVFQIHSVVFLRGIHLSKVTWRLGIATFS